MGIKVFSSEGKNIHNMIKIMQLAKTYVKKYRRPCFLEIKTFRWFEHCGVNFDDHLRYRSKSKLVKWKKIDHLSFLEKKLLKAKIDTKKINKEIQKKIKKAFDFAETSEFPKNKDLFRGVYAN